MRTLCLCEPYPERYCRYDVERCLRWPVAHSVLTLPFTLNAFLDCRLVVVRSLVPQRVILPPIAGQPATFRYPARCQRCVTDCDPDWRPRFPFCVSERWIPHRPGATTPGDVTCEPAFPFTVSPLPGCSHLPVNAHALEQRVGLFPVVFSDFLRCRRTLNATLVIDARYGYLPDLPVARLLVLIGSATRC